MLLPNTHTFTLTRGHGVWPDISSAIVDWKGMLSGSRGIFLPNTHTFLFTRRQNIEPNSPAVIETATIVVSHEQATVVHSAGPEGVVVGDSDRRTFLKAAGIAGAGLIASQLLPKHADALIMGSSPTTGVVGVKNASNTRINPATEETLSTLLKPSDLTFDSGSLQVKVTSLPGAGSSSFSDSGDVAKSGLVDADRHVQVDVLSSTLPSSASTETTLQTISFGGFKFTLRLATSGSIDYVGEAAIGTATSASSWRIKKVDNTSGVVVTWAGTGIFDQIWDNRASLSYS